MNEDMTTAPVTSGAMPSDVAGMDAPTGVVGSALELIHAGGPVVIILLLMSVVALTIVFLKLYQFRSARIGDLRTARDAAALYRAGNTREALATASMSRNPVAETVAVAIRGLHKGLPETKVREEVARVAGDRIEALRGYFRPLEVIGSLAPLLGLFGTVLGMIDAFRQLEGAGNQVNPAILSGGIWVALLTTAVGLAVAIPVVAVSSWLERKVDHVAHEMESIVTQIFTDDLSPQVDERSEPSRLRAAPPMPAVAPGE